ncbi:MAG: hypothetical protein A2X12_07285 [Bacteroidetes bacterium GWE2_29_8]|nr:MAG: hypothetical protein A2X12_07285 [Bacteroidetes bacterium GWE2_29_8]
MLLIVNNNWKTNGLINSNLLPLLTYPNKGDKHIASYKRLEDLNGDNYFVSNPPTLFVFNYYISSLFMSNSKLLIQITSLILLFLTSVCMYYSVYVLIKNNFFAAISIAIYNLSNASLFLYTYNLPLELFLYSFSILLFILFSKTNNIVYGYLTVCISLLFVYTDWLGLFYAIILSFILYKLVAKQHKSKLLSQLCLYSTIAIIFIFAFQTFTVSSSLLSFVKSFSLRFMERTGFFGDKYSSDNLSIYNIQLWKNFILNFNKVLFPLGYIVMIVFIKNYIAIKKIVKNNLLLLLFIPLLIHIVLFFNLNATHYIYSSRIIFTISFIAGISFYNTYKSKINKLNTFFISFFFIASIFYSYYVFDNDNKLRDSYCNLTKIKECTKFIKENINTNEAIILYSVNENIRPEIIDYYSKRNVFVAKTIEEANNFSLQLKQKNYVIINYNNVTIWKRK